MIQDFDLPVSLPIRRFRSKAAQRRAFIGALWRTRSVSHAAAIVGVERTTPYYWRRVHPGFAEQWALVLAVPGPRRPRQVLDLPTCRMNHRLLLYAVRTLGRPPAKISTSSAAQSPAKRLIGKGFALAASRRARAPDTKCPCPPGVIPSEAKDLCSWPP